MMQKITGKISPFLRLSEKKQMLLPPGTPGTTPSAYKKREPDGVLWRDYDCVSRE